MFIASTPGFSSYSSRFWEFRAIEYQTNQTLNFLWIFSWFSNRLLSEAFLFSKSLNVLIRKWIKPLINRQQEWAIGVIWEKEGNWVCVCWTLISVWANIFSKDNHFQEIFTFAQSFDHYYSSLYRNFLKKTEKFHL